MCGICGVLSLDPALRVTEDIPLKMRETMPYRGPDESGLHVDGPVGLGHVRLSIIDIAGGHQPMRDEGTGRVIVYNGEIYNYIELRKGLEERGHRFRTKSDTEVLLKMFVEHGPAAFRDLNGMFAFGIYDPQDRTILLGRDPFGIKPLYYMEENNHFYFASEIKALLAVRTRRAVSAKALADYFAFQYVLPGETLFDGIRQLPPGTWLRAGPRGIETSAYWDVPFDKHPARSPEAHAEQVADLLSSSVRWQLRSDVPVGAHLSGGVDTGGIVSMAVRHYREVSDHAFHTFTVGFEEGGIYDDRAFTNRTATAARTEHHAVYPTASDFERSMGRIMWVMDEPAAGEGVFGQYMVSREARRHVTVVLGGQGADEIFGGYARNYIAYLENAFRRLCFLGGAPADMSVLGLLPNVSQLKNYTSLLKQHLRSGLLASPDERYYRLIARNPDPVGVLGDSLRPRVSTYHPLDSFKEIFNRPRGAEPLDRILHYELRAWLPALLHVEDRMSMAWSLESRVPFLDPRLVEYAFRAPASVKLRGGRLKHLLRAALRGVVPDEILDRRDKIGFPVPIQAWRRRSLQGFMSRLFTRSTLAEDGIVRRESVARIAEGSGEFDRNLWGLICLELWYRQFFRGEKEWREEAALK
ncbi:asparagine synthase (glutamine-hydrolyzing) [bacterium]|nr:asparagine synthase (glutamine-hydrolyzing) [bacterium]